MFLSFFVSKISIIYDIIYIVINDYQTQKGDVIMENKRCVQHKEYTAEVKREILRKHYEEGATSNALAKEYNIPRSTVKNWFAKTNNGIDVLIDRRPQYSGRIANLDTDYKQRYEILKKMEDFLMLQQGRKPSL